ncbi:hypothetical protein P8807_18850 [Bacillus subtilis]|uniref:hypothetical protein n=1 Tax=Bacillus subtilis TaxID=1423 RepID=UPI002DBFB644|nr:hypothetical protein [Bacillus subtilis]MEC0413585.1 hypothetical protein [Bacillus subtilis]MEC0423245.1 hypothetical protein [Bacillus subtilis]
MLSGILEGSEMPQGVGRLAGLRLRADPEGEPNHKAPHQKIECNLLQKRGTDYGNNKRNSEFVNHLECRNGNHIDWDISINPNGNKKDQLKTLVKKTAGNAKG